MVNIIWFILIVSAIIYALITNQAALINSEIFKSANASFTLLWQMLPLIVMWMGFLKIMEESGLLKKFTNFLSPFLRLLFPKLSRDSKALDYIASNIGANMLGLGSAATPFGLKAMQELQKNNPQKDTATTEMITFLVLNTAGVTIIPSTVIAMRLAHHSLNPTGIIITSVIATFCSSMAGLILDYFMRRHHE
jgi:spore maturation protein A